LRDRTSSSSGYRNGGIETGSDPVSFPVSFPFRLMSV